MPTGWFYECTNQLFLSYGGRGALAEAHSDGFQKVPRALPLAKSIILSPICDREIKVGCSQLPEVWADYSGRAGRKTCLMGLFRLIKVPRTVTKRDLNFSM